MARNGSSPGVFVAGITAVAIAVIGFFAYQANAAQERAGSEASPKPGTSASPSPGGKGDSGSGKKGTALPAGSGTGQRVVYSVDRERVWLVKSSGEIARTYKVKPGAVSPKPGSYSVTSRSGNITGSDGVPVENVVRFADEGGTTIGFSAALDGSMPEPDPNRKTGGIRESRADGKALWVFATIGTKVVVVQ